jgi:hypothetical protein
MASASECPSASRARERSSSARAASAAQRSRVQPLPGSGRSSRPDRTAYAKAAAVAAPDHEPARSLPSSGSPAESIRPELIIVTPSRACRAARRLTGQHRGVMSSARCRAPRLRAGRSAARLRGAGGRLSLSMPGRRRNRYGEGRRLWRPAGRTGNASREVVAGNRFHECLRRPCRRRLVTVRYLMYVLLPAWFVPGIADYVMHRRTRSNGPAAWENRGLTADDGRDIRAAPANGT